MKHNHLILFAAALAAVTIACGSAFAAHQSSLLEMSGQLDGIEKQDFQAAIGKATSCTRMRDFSCAEAELAKTVMVANAYPLRVSNGAVF